MSLILPVLLYDAETWTFTSSDEQALGVFERFMDLSAIEQNGAYDGTRSYTIYTMTSTLSSVLKYSVFDGWVMSLVWIAPSQFVKSSNLRKVEVAEKDGLASVGPNRWIRIPRDV